MTHARPRFRECLETLLLTGALLGLAAAGGCSGGVSTGPDHLPFPLIAAGNAAHFCTAPTTSGTVTLTPIGTRVTTNSPATVPINRIDVVGSTSGLAAGSVVVVAMLPVTGECPAVGAVTVTPAADGTFTAELDLGARTRVRVVAVAGASATPPALACGTSTGCLDPTGVTAVSGTVEVRLD